MERGTVMRTRERQAWDERETGLRRRERQAWGGERDRPWASRRGKRERWEEMRPV